MEVLTSTIDHQLDKVYDQFFEEFGFGPCGAYAALRREDGWGDVAVCIAEDGQAAFTHYVIVQDGAIIDMANPLARVLTYSEVEILDADELPELCSEAVIGWLENRIV